MISPEALDRAREALVEVGGAHFRVRDLSDSPAPPPPAAGRGAASSSSAP
jgi:hypothetical protein